MKYIITFMSGYTPITELANKLVEDGDSYYIEGTMKWGNKQIPYKRTIHKRYIVSIKEID